MIRLVLLVFVLAFVACSDPAPVGPPPAGKANCALCGFLGDDRYTIAEGQGGHESPESSAEADSTQAAADSTQAEAETAEADSTQAEAEADSTQADAASSSDSDLESFFGDDRYTATDQSFADVNLVSIWSTQCDRRWAARKDALHQRTLLP